jgi:hypothetical protein
MTALAVAPSESVSRTVNVDAPGVEGVPLMRPVEAPSARFAGREPTLTVHA